LSGGHAPLAISKDGQIAVFRLFRFILYNLEGGYMGMNRQELIIMLTVLAVGVCIIILILLNGL
jgi:hypothetical protein